jgi:CheY-like chemotaxis protein
MESDQSSSQGFSGIINLQLTDLIQMVCLSRSSLTVCVRSGNGSGTIYVREGEIHHAKTEKFEGEPAFFEMFRWKDGQFEMLPFQDLGIDSMDRSWEYLLLQAMRQRDEDAAKETLEDKDFDDEDFDRELDQEAPITPPLSEEPARDSEAYEQEQPEAPVFPGLDDNIDLAFDKYSSNGDASARVAKPVLEESRTQPAAQLHPARPVRVLVVDDSPFFARQLKKMLEEDLGIQVVATAKNGKEAVDLLASGPASIDLITLDVQMPVMPGDSALKHIMVRFGIPVLMISSFHTQSLNDIFEFLQLGAVDFIPKPDVKEDITAYGEQLRDKVKRAARSDVSHFRRWRKPKSDPRHKATTDQPEKSVLVILGAEGAYMDWFRLPLRQLSRKGLVIGLQKLPDPFLPGFCNLIKEKTSSITAPLMHSEWISPGTFYLGNASHRIKLQLVPRDMALGIEILPSERLSWDEGIQQWVSQLAEQPGFRMSICFLSAVHSFSAHFIEHLLQCNTRMILSPLDTMMCTDLVESIVPYAQSHKRQIVWASPENLMEVWLDYVE